MKISDVKIRRIYPDGKLRAIVSVTLDGQFVIHDIKIISMEDKTFVAMPSRRDETGRFRDIVHPLNAETRSEMENAILEGYKALLPQFSEL